MPRTLTAARAMVRPEDDDQYRALLGARAAAARARGANFWVFRSCTDPGAYLEFVESGSGSAGARSAREIELEHVSRTLAAYGPDAEDVWEEVECRDGSSK